MSKPVRTMLMLGAHPDDIEIGAGGTILRLVAEQRPLTIHWVVFSGTAERAKEAKGSAEALLGSLVDREVIVHDFPDRYFPWSGAEIKDAFVELGRTVRPDLVLTHRRADEHQDHRLIAELTWQTFRNHLILEYEVPKYEGDLGAPNFFVPLDEATARHKVDLLMSGFPSQAQQAWFTPDTFWSLLRLRGLECGSPTRYAEGFHARKMVLPCG
ncbi:MAG: PIG-L deacetylase family protein [Egibacteraceae bacterium]